MKKSSSFVKCLDFFLESKIILKGSKVDFIQVMYYITVIDYWCNHT